MEINSTEKLRFWCQKVLPLVYDDSLSYYEVLCKIANTLNILIDNNNKLPEYIEEKIIEYVTSDDFEDVLKKYMAHYVEDEHKIVFGGDIIISEGDHVYTEKNKTITIVGR